LEGLFVLIVTPTGVDVLVFFHNQESYFDEFFHDGYDCIGQLNAQRE